MKSKDIVVIAFMIVIIGFSLWWLNRATTITLRKDSPVPRPALVAATPASLVEQPKVAPVTPNAETARSASPATVPLAMDDPVAIDARITEVINNLQKNAPLSPRLQVQLDALLAVKGKSAVIDAEGKSGRYDPVFVDDQQVQVILIKRNGGWAVNFKVADGLKSPGPKSSSGSATSN